MNKNIIILTSGLSGSSVVANLISKAGYWTGDSTCKKNDYDTHENCQLVFLNDMLLKHLGYDTAYRSIVRLGKVSEAGHLFDTIDLLPFKQFVSECGQSEPWLWKDPRLWITMPFWIRLLDKENVLVVVVDRSVQQRWISELLRRNIQSFSYCKHYNDAINRLIRQFVADHQLPCCELLFDDLIERPEATLDSVNAFLGCMLTLDDLQGVYNKPLYMKTRGLKHLGLALLIYMKNYWVRLK
ncbi:MAG: hypothetical protein Q8N96_05505 [Methylovulum sp.]|nr:hypothetical protein [Methylovulum sp.]